MDPSVFRSPTAGRAVRTAEGYWAFVPAPLPPEMRYDAELVMHLSWADAALSELSGLGRHLPNPHLLIAPYVRREAVLSSRIEGTQATFDEVLEYEARGGPGDRPPERVAEIHEVLNYRKALREAERMMADLPLCLRVISAAHRQLMEGVRADVLPECLPRSAAG